MVLRSSVALLSCQVITTYNFFLKKLKIITFRIKRCTSLQEGKKFHNKSNKSMRNVLKKQQNYRWRSSHTHNNISSIISSCLDFHSWISKCFRSCFCFSLIVPLHDALHDWVSFKTLSNKSNFVPPII